MGMIAPMENIRRHAMFSGKEEKRSPERNPRQIPTFVWIN
jgi:hypothetical protein